jgi:hypothetical protein
MNWCTEFNDGRPWIDPACRKPMTAAAMNPPSRAVVALSSTWCYAGEVVTPGQSYSLPPHEAARLVAAGKARFESVT